MKKFFNFYLMVMSASLFLITSSDSFAESLGFSAQVIQPKSQIDSNIPYLDLRLAPSEKETLTIKVQNNSAKKKLKIAVSYSSAKTNSEGIIEYAPFDMPIDKSLKNDFSKIVSGPKVITLKPKEQKEMQVNIKMPQNSFDGYVAGGIELKQLTEKKDTEMLSTELSYIIGARISQNDKVVPLELEFRKIQVGYRYGRPVIMTYLANVNGNYVENMQISVGIRKQGTNKILATQTKESMRMAPNSMILYPVPLDNKAIGIGKYEALIDVSTKEGYKNEWVEPFAIKENIAGKYETKKVEETTPKSTINFLYVFLFLGLLLALIVFFVKVRR